jgi:hypothetical protein
MTISWYSIRISLPSGGIILNGYFTVYNTTNLVTAFYEKINGSINFNNNILGPDTFPPPLNFYTAQNTYTNNDWGGLGTNISSVTLQAAYNTDTPYFNIYAGNVLWRIDDLGANISITSVSNPIPISNICFPAGTPIKTNQGEISIEKINPEIHTIRNKPIVGITKTIHASDKYLVCFLKDSLGNNIPSQKTITSKNHKIFYNGKMTTAFNLIGLNDKITKLEYKGEILYNVLMEEYDKIIVNNLICETLHPENNIAKLYRICQKLNIEEQQNLIQYYNDKCKKQNNISRK